MHHDHQPVERVLMAVVRPELMTREVERLLSLVKDNYDGTEADKKLLKTLERETRKAHDLDEDDRRRRAKTQRMLRTSKEDVCPDCWHVPPRHSKDCPALEKA